MYKMTEAIDPCHFSLPCRIQHIFDEDPVAHGWVVDKDVGHGDDEFAVPDNGAAGQE